MNPPPKKKNYRKDNFNVANFASSWLYQENLSNHVWIHIYSNKDNKSCEDCEEYEVTVDLRQINEELQFWWKNADNLKELGWVIIRVVWVDENMNSAFDGVHKNGVGYNGKWYPVSNGWGSNRMIKYEHNSVIPK